MRAHGPVAAVDHDPPARRGCVDAQTNETEKGLGKDIAWNGHGLRHDARTEDVGQQVPKDNAHIAGPDHLGPLDELFLLVGQHLTAGDACHADPVQRTQGDKDEQHTAHFAVQLDERLGDDARSSPVGHSLEINLQEDDENEERKAPQNVDNAHHDAVDGASKIARDQAVHQADGQADQGGDDGHREADARAIDDAGQDVAPKLVGAQKVAALRVDKARLFVILLEGLIVHAVGRDQGGKDRRQNEQDQKDPAPHSHLVLYQNKPRVLQGAAGFADDPLFDVDLESRCFCSCHTRSPRTMGQARPN